MAHRQTLSVVVVVSAKKIGTSGNASVVALAKKRHRAGGEFGAESWS
jgi:hypothetical protein